VTVHFEPKTKKKFITPSLLVCHYIRNFFLSFLFYFFSFFFIHIFYLIKTVSIIYIKISAVCRKDSCLLKVVMIIIQTSIASYFGRPFWLTGCTVSVYIVIVTLSFQKTSLLTLHYIVYVYCFTNQF
jgi:hypothetical protein